MILSFYSFVLSLLCLLLGLPLLPLLLILPFTRRGLLQRLGFVPREVRSLAVVGQGSLWVHAASLGEINAVAPVVKLLTQKLDNVPLLITCTTQAGKEQARLLFPEATAIIFLPLDLPLFLNPIFKRFKPRFALIAETELWPNLLHGLHARGCQVLLANGRMTQRSLKRYLWFKSLFASCLLCFDSLAMQSQEDASRVIELGAKASRVVVTGNTKFDALEAAKEARRKGEILRSDLGLSAGQAVIVAGSSRPGEEALLLEAFASLRKQVKGLSLILAPRHMDRVEEVAKIIESQGFACSRRSQGVAKSDVILLDTLGELAGAYSLAKLAWIGGSWADWGGQNPLEAAAQGVALIFGPSMDHFKEPAKILLEAKAALQVNPQDLRSASLSLLKDDGARQAMGKAGLAALKGSAGASQRTADLAWKLAVLARLRRDEHDWRSQSAFASLKVSEFGSSLEARD